MSSKEPYWTKNSDHKKLRIYSLEDKPKYLDFCYSRHIELCPKGSITEKSIRKLIQMIELPDGIVIETLEEWQKIKR